jgi:hypothetical protein
MGVWMLSEFCWVTMATEIFWRKNYLPSTIKFSFASDQAEESRKASLCKQVHNCRVKWVRFDYTLMTSHYLSTKWINIYCSIYAKHVPYGLAFASWSSILLYFNMAVSYSSLVVFPLLTCTLALKISFIDVYFSPPDCSFDGSPELLAMDHHIVWNLKEQDQIPKVS